MKFNMKNNKWYYNSLYRAISVAQWCVLICAILTFLTGPEQLWLGIVEIVVFAVLLLLNVLERKRRHLDVQEYMKTLNSHMDTATKDSLVNFPFPMVVAHLDGKVSWYNQSFAKIIEGESLFERNITEIINDLNWSDVLRMQEGISLNVVYRERQYSVMGNIIKPDPKRDNEYLILLYWLDQTDYKTITKKYLEEKTDVCIILLDNYDDVMNSMEESFKPQMSSSIVQYINEWTGGVEGVLKKLDRDRYMFMFEHKYLKHLIDGKFEVLDHVREISLGNKTPATISIGIGCGGETISQNDEYARTALDMALGRGGDQAVIKDDNQFSFYGGKTKEHEKSTRVKSRVVAYALRQLIVSEQNVVIMGHKSPDMDSLGAAIGLSRAVKNRSKKVNIVCGDCGDTAQKMVRRMLDEDESNVGLFVTPEEANELVNEDTVLIVVDTHRPSLMENPELLKKAGEIVLIDHHRRSTEFIENCSLVYHEPYASSASEMVTELLQYMDNRTMLTKLEAEAVYAGIYLDTKNFTFKTGVRTFDAASFLRKHGVDTAAVKRMFQSDLPHYNIKAEIVGRAEFVRDNIVISVCDREVDDTMIVAAQAADELLGIEGVEASFVLARSEEAVIISGRSWGGVNVQLILEKLGGGGHLTVAGAQMRDVEIDEVRESLLGAIDEYMSEIE